VKVVKCSVDRFTADRVRDCPWCGCFGRLKVEELCAAKDSELMSLSQNCLRLENELASVRKVSFLLLLLQMLFSE